MKGRVSGKVAVVTGAASGIGEASARRLAAEGAKVVIADSNGKGAERVAKDLGDRAVPFTVDVGDYDGVREMIDLAVRTFGGLHILHNNAAHVPIADGRVADMEVVVWERVLRVNLTAPMLASKYAIPIMIDNGGGSIIHTASMAGLQAEDTRTGYGATKSGLLALSRSIAVQYGKQGIRSNVICPGLTLSPAVREQLSEDQRELMAAYHFTPRGLAEPSEQAAVVLFLASDESSFVNGQWIGVDGGLCSAQPFVAAIRQSGFVERQRKREA